MKKICALLLMFAMACLSAVYSLTGYKPTKKARELHPKSEYCRLVVFQKRPEPYELPSIYKDILRFKGNIEITYIDLEYEYIGTYFITAYCPSECGWNGDPDSLAGWQTASGEICHRSDWDRRLLEPTTCAIDRNYHAFGDLFYIEEFDRVFVAEDTGSAVKGRHLDLFYEDYDDVITFPTGYYAVYSVEYVTKTMTVCHRTQFTF